MAVPLSPVIRRQVSGPCPVRFRRPCVGDSPSVVAYGAAGAGARVAGGLADSDVVHWRSSAGGGSGSVACGTGGGRVRGGCLGGAQAVCHGGRAVCPAWQRAGRAVVSVHRGGLPSDAGGSCRRSAVQPGRPQRLRGRGNRLPRRFEVNRWGLLPAARPPRRQDHVDGTGPVVGLAPTCVHPPARHAPETPVEHGRGRWPTPRSR